MLLLFVVGTAPKIYLHDALANHKDGITVCTHAFPKAPCLHPRPVNCHVELLVVTAFYLFNAEPPLLHVQQQFRTINCLAASDYAFLRVDVNESRGPPPACS